MILKFNINVTIISFYKVFKLILLHFEKSSLAQKKKKSPSIKFPFAMKSLSPVFHKSAAFDT